jgi:YlmC/YmxH family sporulation protein
MLLNVGELRNKQVVCVHTGDVLGYVGDIVIDSQDGRLQSIIIVGKPRLLGLLGKYEDITIPWADIEVIGAETVLVKNNTQFCK